jgi:hypothetical protein
MASEGGVKVSDFFMAANIESQFQADPFVPASSAQVLTSREEGRTLSIVGVGVGVSLFLNFTADPGGPEDSQVKPIDGGRTTQDSSSWPIQYPLIEVDLGYGLVLPIVIGVQQLFSRASARVGGGGGWSVRGSSRTKRVGLTDAKRGQPRKKKEEKDRTGRHENQSKVFPRCTARPEHTITTPTNEF